MRTKALGVTILLGILALTARPSMQTPGRQAGRVEQINGRSVVAGEVLVKFRSGAAAGERLAAIEALSDAESVVPVGRGGTRRLRSRSHSADALVRLISGHPDVEYAEPNFIYHANGYARKRWDELAARFDQPGTAA